MADSAKSGSKKEQKKREKKGGQELAADKVTQKRVAKKKVSKKKVVKKKVSKKRVAKKRAVTRTATAPVGSSQTISPRERYEMIARMAYFRAEQRGFQPGNELDDWLECEQVVDRMIGNVQE